MNRGVRNAYLGVTNRGFANFLVRGNASNYGG